LKKEISVNLKITGLYSLFEDSIRCIEALGPKFTAYRKKLEELEKRLYEGRFHLAGLGQFKRGKSTFPFSSLKKSSVSRVT